jgi:broad specificity phosphatase PhoE
MRNTYYLMRHGWSESNEKAIAVSSSDKALTGFGLTKKGRLQAERAANIFLAKHTDIPVIYSSDFLRAVQTAEPLAVKYNVEVQEDSRLRERDFGELDGTSADNYHRIWDFDSDPDSTAYHSESLRQMVDRVQSLIYEIERQYEKRIIVLVSHGDPLVAINSYYMYGDYRPLIHKFGNAEIRRIDEATPTVSVE